MLIKVEGEPEIHVKNLLNKFQKRTVEKQSLATVHNPAKDPVSFIAMHTRVSHFAMICFSDAAFQYVV